MTNAQALRNLHNLTFDQLAAGYTLYNAKACEATTRVGLGRALAARDRIADEVARRGAVIRKSHYFGDYMVGRPADFEPK